MDPLSLTVSIVTLLGAGGVIAKGFGKVRNLKNAPTILLQLNNEVSDLTLLVRAVDEVYRSHRTAMVSPSQEAFVCSTLERARDMILDLEKLVEYTLTKWTSSGSQVNRSAWIGSLDRIKEMKSAIRTTRDELITVWAALSNRHVSDRIELRLQEFSVTMGSMQSGLQDHQNLLDHMSSFRASSGQLLDALREELRRAVRPMPMSEDQQSVSPLPDPNPIQNSTSGTAFGTSAYRPTTLALYLSEGRRKDCKCSCHRQTRFRSPSSLSHVFGSLFIGYVGILGFSTECTFTRLCCQGAETKGSLAYVFPLWLVALVFMAKIELSQRKGPQMLIRCLRVRAHASVPFQAGSQQQWGQLETLVGTGKASVLDVSEEGISFLSQALRPSALRRSLQSDDKFKEHHSLVELLLYEGTDVHQENQFMMSSYRFVWHYCLINRAAKKTHPILHRILGKGNPIDTFDFPDLHVVVLGLGSPLTFEATLALTSRGAVNDLDYVGRTALSWAAELGDFEKIEMLLMRGADPNIADRSGKSSLHWCAHKVDCMTALLDAGADVDQQEKVFGRSKLMQFITDSKPYDDIDCVDLLWKRGACLNRLQGCKRAPIHYSVAFYRPKILRWLLGKSIDLEARTERGCKILQHFLGCDVGEHPDVLEMIMDSHPDCHARGIMEEDSCHYVARFGSLGYLQVFQRRAGFARMDVDRRSESSLIYDEKALADGTTAMELAEWRRDHQSEWAIDNTMDLDPDPEAYFNAFKDWIDSLRAVYIAGLLKKMETSDKTCTEDEVRGEMGMATEQTAEIDEDLRRRVPGSFPDE